MRSEGIMVTLNLSVQFIFLPVVRLNHKCILQPSLLQHTQGDKLGFNFNLGRKAPKNIQNHLQNRRYHRTGSGNSMSMISLEGVKGQVSASDQGHLTGAEAFNWLQNNMVSVMSLGGT